jgi:hypothetical protein
VGRLRELLKYNLRSVRAYLVREDIQRFWSYVGWDDRETRGTRQRTP